MTDTYVDELARICDEAARVFLDGLPAVPPDATPTPFWELDRGDIEASIGSDEPHRWVHEIVSSCLSEAANELLAIGALLRCATVTASLDPLVRAVVERAGLVNWVLDHEATARQRAIRSGLEVVVSLQHYRQAMVRLGADNEHRSFLRREQSRLNHLLEDWFEVERPPSDPADESSKPTKDVTLWVIEGECYPSLTKIAELGMGRGHVDAGLAAGSYGVLSGFSHPSLFFGQEHRNVGEDSTVTYTYRYIDLEKLTRLGVLTFMDGVRHWLGYYCANQATAIERTDAIATALDSISIPGEPDA
jgi:hypothetical protein